MQLANEAKSNKMPFEVGVFITYMVLCIIFFVLNEYIHSSYNDRLGVELTNAFIGICVFIATVLFVVVIAPTRLSVKRFFKGFLYAYEVITIAIIALGVFG
jgi:Mn2+/Fe2+ NRAMP family transporter